MFNVINPRYLRNEILITRLAVPAMKKSVRTSMVFNSIHALNQEISNVGGNVTISLPTSSSDHMVRRTKLSWKIFLALLQRDCTIKGHHYPLVRRHSDNALDELVSWELLIYFRFLNVCIIMIWHGRIGMTVSPVLRINSPSRYVIAICYFNEHVSKSAILGSGRAMLI